MYSYMYINILMQMSYSCERNCERNCYNEMSNSNNNKCYNSPFFVLLKSIAQFTKYLDLDEYCFRLIRVSWLVSNLI